MNDTGDVNVLFLCTGNSARSILAEAIGNTLAQPGWRFHSAGSTPTGTVNPGALGELERRGLPTEGYRSKSWDEFSGAEGIQFDWVITLCDNAANEACPVFPGVYQRSHWGLPDPATGAATFSDTFDAIKTKISSLISS